MRSNNNTKERERTRALIAKMFLRDGVERDIAEMIADEHICRTRLAPTDANYIETRAPMATYVRANAFIEAVIAQLADITNADVSRGESVALFDTTAKERVSFETRTKREAQLAQLFADVVSIRARFDSVATLADFLRARGVIVIRNRQHSQSAWNFVTMREDGNIANTLIYALAGHDNNAQMLCAPITLHTGNDDDVVRHIEEEVKVLSVRACGCPVEVRDPLGHIDTLTKRGIATGARAVAVALLARHDAPLTGSNDVRQTIAHRWDIAGIWNDAEDVAEWASREVKRGHESAI